MKCVFMGTPDFAVPCLEALCREHQVVAVFCQPDKPKGRTHKLIPCPVKKAAEVRGISVYQPRRIRARKWVRILRELAPDAIVVAAFGQILSQAILDIPKIDCLNVHASVLPRWRGASPIHYAIKSGDETTGISIMKMVLELDAGPVYRQKEIPIPAQMGRQELEIALSELGSELLLETLEKVGQLKPQPQPDQGVTYAPIIQKNFGFLDFGKHTAAQIVNGVRAFEGWPGVSVRFRGTPVKLIAAREAMEETEGKPGEIVQQTKKTLRVACSAHTSLWIDTLQPAGKKEQPVAAFINGYRPEPGEHFEPMDPK